MQMCCNPKCRIQFTQPYHNWFWLVIPSHYTVCTQFSREKSANCPGFKVNFYSVVWQAKIWLSLKMEIYRLIVATVVACAQLCNTM